MASNAMNLQRMIQKDALPPDVPAGHDAPPIGAFISLETLLRVLRTRLLLILGTAAIVVALVSIGLYRTTPLYTARALVMLDTGRNQIFENATSLSGAGGGGYYNNSTMMENQVQVLNSRALAERVVEELGLDREPAIASAAPAEATWTLGLLQLFEIIDPRNWFSQTQVSILTETEEAENRQEALISSVLGGLRANVLGFSSAIEITYVDANPERAAQMANALADAYVDDQLNAKFEASERATQWLTERVQELADQVRDADVAVQQYKADNNLTDVSGISVIDQQLAATNGQLIIARSELAEQEARYARVEELQNAGQAQDISQVVASPLINSLRAQESELLAREADFASRYGPRHPRVLDLQAEKRNLLAKIDEEAQRIVETIRNDLTVTRARVRSLESSLNQAAGRTSEDSRARIRLRELEANAASSHAMYDAFLSRFNEMQGQEGVQLPDSRIMSHAVVPESPTSPNVSRTMTLAGGTGLILGFLLGLLMERLDSGFRTASQVEKTIGLPVLASVPEVPSRSKSRSSASGQVITKPVSPFSEAIRGLQMGIQLSNVDSPPGVILVTSAVPGEGKTTVAASVARLAAMSGKKVLIIDCDLRRPAIASELGLDKSEKGLIEVLTGSCAVEECLKKDPISTVEFLPTKFKVGNPIDILSSEAMEHLLSELRQKYDLIVIDSAPILPVNDTRVVARFADAVLFAVRWEKTPREAVSSAVRVLSESHAPLAGIVLTRTDGRRFQYYSYGNQDYQAYNKYYNT